MVLVGLAVQVGRSPAEAPKVHVLTSVYSSSSIAFDGQLGGLRAVGQATNGNESADYAHQHAEFGKRSAWSIVIVHSCFSQRSDKPLL